MSKGLYFKDNTIRSCVGGTVIEAVIHTETKITPWYIDKPTKTSLPPKLISKTYKLQTFFGNDIYVEVDADNKIIDYSMCNVRHIDWDEHETELEKKYHLVNRDIARMFAEQCEVIVEEDDNWRRENEGEATIVQPFTSKRKIELIWDVINQTVMDCDDPLCPHENRVSKIEEILRSKPIKIK